MNMKYLWIGGAAALVLFVAVAGALIFSNHDATVARVNGVNISSSDVTSELRQVEHMLMMEYFDMFPEDYEIDYDRPFREGQSFGRVLREEAVRMAALFKLYEDYARQRGISVTTEERVMINQHIDSLIDEFGTSQFNDILRIEGIRDRAHLLRIFEIQQMIDDLTWLIIDEPDEFARFEAYMVVEVDDAQERAQALYARAQAGEDFDLLIAMYGEDPGMQGNTEGYTFRIGDMVPEFELATLMLEIGEISQPVRSDFGYHIILRTEPIPELVWGDPALEGEELLGAKHILISSSARSQEEMMAEAILLGFEAMVDDADIVFLSALDRVPIPRE